VIRQARTEPEFKVANPEAPVSQEAIDTVASFLLEIVDQQNRGGQQSDHD